MGEGRGAWGIIVFVGVRKIAKASEVREIVFVFCNHYVNVCNMCVCFYYSLDKNSIARKESINQCVNQFLRIRGVSKVSDCLESDGMLSSKNVSMFIRVGAGVVK